MTIKDRATGWLTPQFHLRLREILLHTCARYRLTCPVYCLMPDHLHLLWVGYVATSDQLVAVEFFRKQLRAILHPFAFQREPYDHVLQENEREPELFETVAAYILENPERAGLVERYPEYEFLGCMIPGYPELNVTTTDYWERFWRVYQYLCRHAKTG